MNNNNKNRWTFEAVVSPNDKIRLRSFIKNEIAYYNALLVAFAARLRTMPTLLNEVNRELMGEVAAHEYNVQAMTPETLPKSLERFRSVIFSEGGFALSGNMLLFLKDVSVGSVLHPETRRAMALQMLAAHQKITDSLSRTSSKLDQVLVAPVELLHPLEARVKRHVQLPRKAVVTDGETIRTSYNAVPISFKFGSLPAEATWDVLVIRDDESNGTGNWVAEFRQSETDYIVRLTDVPVNTKKRRREYAR